MMSFTHSNLLKNLEKEALKSIVGKGEIAAN